MKNLLKIELIFLIATVSGVYPADSEKPYYRAEMICSPTLRFPRCHSSNLIALPDGSLLCAWWSGSEEGAPDNVILSALRPAGQRGWQAPRVLTDTPDTTDSNPVFFLYSAEQLWLLYRTGLPWVRLMRIRSNDLGLTWSKPEIFLDEPGVTLRSGILRLENGRIIIPLMRYHDRDGALSQAKSVFLLSAKAEKGWDFSKEFDSAIQGNEPALAQRKDGSLLAFMRPYGIDSGRLFIIRSESRDRGRTWSEPELTDLKNPSSAVDLHRLRNGHLVLAFNDNQKSRTDLSLALSLDEGQSWSSRRVLENALGRFSYPSLAQSMDELVHVSYTFRRTHIKHVEVNEAWIMDQH